MSSLMRSTHQHLIGIPGVLTLIRPTVVEDDESNIISWEREWNESWEINGEEREMGRWKWGKPKKDLNTSLKWFWGLQKNWENWKFKKVGGGKNYPTIFVIEVSPSLQFYIKHQSCTFNFFFSFILVYSTWMTDFMVIPIIFCFLDSFIIWLCKHKPDSRP